MDGGSNVVYARRVSTAGFTIGNLVYPASSGATAPLGLASNGTDWMTTFRSSTSEVRVSRELILSEVWQMSEAVETRTVDAHIRNLRRKIGSDRIATVIGFGYRYEPPEG